MNKVQRDDAVAAAALLLAAFVCYGGTGIARLGFYVDDWHLLAGMSFAPPGWIAAMRGLVVQAGAIVFRPFEIPLFAGLYQLNGLDPLRWQLSLMAMSLAASWNLRRLMLRFGADEGAALLAALLLFAWPSKDAVMFWSCTVFLPFALAAFLGAYRLHLEFVESGSRLALAGAGACLLVSLTSYDQCMFLFPLWLLIPSRGDAARRRALWGTAMAGAIAVLVVLYQFEFVPRLLGHPHNKTTVFSFSHALFVYARGFGALFGADLARRTLSLARVEAVFSPFLAICAVFAAAGALLVRGEEKAPLPRRRLLAFGAGLIVLGYLPIVFSDYVPVAFSHMNRINLVPAAGAALLIAELLALLRRARLGLVLGVLLACLFFTAHARSAGSWVESYRRQLVMRNAVLSQMDKWPSDCTLLLRMPELYVDGVVPIFLAHYDSSAAFEIWTGVLARRADVLLPTTRFFLEGVENDGRKMPYASIRMLDAATGRILQLGAKPAPAK